MNMIALEILSILFYSINCHNQQFEGIIVREFQSEIKFIL